MLYKFLGKKGAFYQLDLEPFSIKLNYKCKEGTVEEGSFSCGNTPEEAKKNYEKQQKEKLPSSKSKLVPQNTAKITKKDYDNLNSKLEIAKSIYSKASKEENKYLNEHNYDTTSNEYKKLKNIKDLALKEFNNLNHQKDTYNEIKEKNKKSKTNFADNESKPHTNKTIDRITSELNEISQITNPIHRQQFILDNPKLDPLKKYQEDMKKERETKIKELENKISTIYKNEKDPKIAEKKEIVILNELEPLQKRYSYAPIKNWDTDCILEYYSSEHYETVNRTIDSKNQPKKCVEFINRLSSIINSNKIENNVITFRGISDSAYDKLVSKGMKIGSEIKCSRFTSTSKNIAVAYDFAITNQKNKDSKINIIKCEIPKGTPAMDMTKHLNSNYYEEEILLNTGQQFKIENIEENDKYRIIHWKAI